MPGVLIISRDWQTRALLRAQLIEDGCDVRAFVSPDQAKAALARIERSKREIQNSKIQDSKTQHARIQNSIVSRGSIFAPGLVIADVSGVSDRGEIEQLASLIRSLPAAVPLWVIASRGEPGQESIELLKEAHLEKVLFRPIDGGELVGRIKGRIRDQGPGTKG